MIWFYYELFCDCCFQDKPSDDFSQHTSRLICRACFANAATQEHEQ